VKQSYNLNHQNYWSAENTSPSREKFVNYKYGALRDPRNGYLNCRFSGVAIAEAKKNKKAYEDKHEGYCADIKVMKEKKRLEHQKHSHFRGMSSGVSNVQAPRVVYN